MIFLLTLVYFMIFYYLNFIIRKYVHLLLIKSSLQNNLSQNIIETNIYFEQM
jgi:hypothetical protein